MIKEFERVVLLKDLKGTPFVKGDVGTIVTEQPGMNAFEVEFFALVGTTLGVETAASDTIKSVNGFKKVIHVDALRGV